MRLFWQLLRQGLSGLPGGLRVGCHIQRAVTQPRCNSRLGMAHQPKRRRTNRMRVHLLTRLLM